MSFTALPLRKILLPVLDLYPLLQEVFLISALLAPVSSPSPCPDPMGLGTSVFPDWSFRET